jgi:hypothetical protein
VWLLIKNFISHSCYLGGLKILLYFVAFSIIFIVGFIFYEYWNSSNLSRKIYLFSSITILFVISGIRGESVGTDTANYLRGFRGIRNAHFNEMFEIERWETGYVLLNKLSSYISDNDQVILFVTSVLALIGVGYFIYKNSNNVVFSLYLFVSLYLYFFSFNGIRQAIAISIIVSGFHLIRERSLFKYLIIVLIASFFHVTAILMLGIYFVYGIRINKRNTSIILIFFFLLYFLLEPIINTILMNITSLSYLADKQLFEGSGLLFPLISLSVLALLLFVRLTEEPNKYFDYLILMVLFSFFVSIISLQVSLILRINYYLMIFYIIAIPYALRLVRDKKLRIILTYFSIVITLTYLIIRMIEGWHGIQPYLIF